MTSRHWEVNSNLRRDSRDPLKVDQAVWAIEEVREEVGLGVSQNNVV